MPAEMIQDVSLADIEIVPLLRKSIDEEKVNGLMLSIKEVGVLYPPRLTRDGNKFIPEGGCHRLLAMMKLGWKKTPAIIEDQPLTEGAMIQKGLIANGHRSDCTPLEKAEAIAHLMELTEWNATVVATKLGLSNATVSRLLGLLQLPEPIRLRVHRGEIPLSSASELAKVDNPEKQAALASKVASGDLTRDALARTVKSNGNSGTAKSGGASARVTAKLDHARAVTVVGKSLDLESFIDTLEELLSKARKARSSGIEVGTFVRMLKQKSDAVAASVSPKP